MKKFLLVAFVITCFTTWIDAQNRYVDMVFEDVDKQLDVTYGANVDVLQQALIELKTDVYMPVGDTLENRPAVILAHTGSFIPRVINQSPTGFKDDSVIVEIATRLARRGYVVFPFTYRQGWLPQAVDDNVRKGSLLQAAYRAIQDARSLIRYIRRTEAEFGNPYGIDGSKIGAWGIGTGGYLSFGAATLDEYEEVVLPKFINTATLLPYVDTTVLGNIWGTSFGVLNGDTVAVPNNVGYSSEVQASVNMGGALGDQSWIDGDVQSNEPPMVGFHCPTDAFAPYFSGPVIVPGPNFVVLDQASGTRQAVGLANDFLINEPLDVIPESQDPLRPIMDFYSDLDVNIGGQMIKLGTDHFYPFTGLTPGAGNPWDWWDYNVLQARVASINAALGTDYSADTIHQSALLTNPDMSPEKAKAYIDTIMMVAAPRLCAGLGLDCGFSNIDQIDATEVEFNMYPNPAGSYIQLSSSDKEPIQAIIIYNTAGQIVDRVTNVGTSEYQHNLQHLSAGVYYMGVTFDKGMVVDKLSIVR